MYIHQQKYWPNFEWNTDKELVLLISKVRNLQGKLISKMQALGFDLVEEAVLETIILDVIKSSKIEGENLNTEEVRSSVAKRLGMNVPALKTPSRNVDGVVEMVLDATQCYNKGLTNARLFAWHAALFPTGYSGTYKIEVGNYRKEGTDPMQVVSGAMGKEKIHFEAPMACRVKDEMKQFLKWFNSKEDKEEPLVKAAIAHLWFVTIHPMDDGNGRIARAITDMQLSRSDQTNQRFYSMSNQIELDKKRYYTVLEKTQKGNLDISDWIKWFLECLLKALVTTESTLANVFKKAKFWDKHRATPLSKRQQKMLNKLHGDFIGKLTTTKWAKMCKCSQDTAHRDIKDLILKKMMKQEASGGRSTSYVLVYPK